MSGEIKTREELVFRLRECALAEDFGGVNKLLDSHGFLLGECTLEEVGGIFGISRERARQIEKQALKKLKAPKVCGEERHKRLRSLYAFPQGQA